MEIQTFNLLEPEELPCLPETMEKPHEEDAYARKLWLQDELRACWKRGEGWQIEFGGLLRHYRLVTEHGEWIKFLKSEFDLHRQTAWRWMRKAGEADGNPFLDEYQTHVDEPDTFAETVNAKINDARDQVENAKSKTAPFRMILDNVSPSEREEYQAACKENRERVQDILREALNEIIGADQPDTLLEVLEANQPRPRVRIMTNAELGIISSEPEISAEAF